MSIYAADGFYWQMVDPDRGNESFREGHGFESLNAALVDITAYEDEHVPQGFTPSGNISIYWSRRKLGGAA